MSIRIVSALLALGTALVGCASLGTPPMASSTSISAYERTQALPEAVVVAESLRDSYLNRAASQRQDDRWAGLGLIGIGLLAGDLAIRGVASSEVLGLGLAGVGLQAANRWSNPPSEWRIYIEGAGAIQCALTAVKPLRNAYPRKDELTAAIGGLDSGADGLAESLRAFDGDQTPRVVQARNAVDKARAMSQTAKAARTRLQTAGGDLYSVVGDIRVQVERQQAISAPDFGALVTSLVGQKIIGPSPLLAVPDPKTKASGSADTLVAPTKALEALIASTEDIVLLVNAKPATASLENCRVNVAAAGITMKVEPSTMTVQAGSTMTALASGGVPSYNATWLSTAPPADQIVLKAEGNGVISVEAKASAQTASYTLLVIDSSKGRESLKVDIVAAPPSALPTTPQPPPTVPDVPQACAKPDANVKAVQEALLKNDIKTVKIDNKDFTLVADGCQGKITNEAITQFYIKQGMDRASIETDPAKLLSQAASDLLKK